MQQSGVGDDHPIVLFDGVCNLCTGTVKFIVKRDRRGVFRFAALQSEFGAALLRRHGVEPSLDSFTLVEGGRVYQRSTASLRVARRLNGLWPLVYVFIAVPRPLRDWVYKLVARNRYKWWGKSESCMLPTEELRGRFLG